MIDDICISQCFHIEENLLDNIEKFKDDNKIKDIPNEYIRAWLRIFLIIKNDPFFRNGKNLIILEELLINFPEIIYINALIAKYYFMKGDNNKSLEFCKKGAELGCPISMIFIYKLDYFIVSGDIKLLNLKKIIELGNIYAQDLLDYIIYINPEEIQ